MNEIDMKSTDYKTNQLIAYIKDHGVNVRLTRVEKEPDYFVEKMEVEDVFTNKYGVEFRRWIALAPDHNEVRDWLGY